MIIGQMWILKPLWFKKKEKKERGFIHEALKLTAYIFAAVPDF